MLALAGMCTVASAQTGFGWGVKGGLNLTGVTNLGDNSQTKTGFVVGAFADYRFTDHFALSADVLYSRQGVSLGENDEGVRTKARLNYLNVPILANYYIVGGLAVKAGIQPGFLLNSKAVAKQDGNTVKSDIEGLSGADFSIPVGVSYDCPFARPEGGRPFVRPSRRTPKRKSRPRPVTAWPKRSSAGSCIA